MTAVSNSPLPPTPVSNVSPTAETANAANKTSGTVTANETANFGPAVEVSLSAPAKTIVEGQNPVANSTQVPTTTTAAPTSPSPADTDAASTSNTAPSNAPKSAPASNGIVYDKTAAAISSSRRIVAAQVGVANANQLVDKNGNINKVGLAEEVADLQK